MIGAGTTSSKALRDAVHDLNNLCATIFGFASLAENAEPENTAISAYLTEIRLATEGVAAIAAQLRTLSKELEAAAK